uniref:Uncharacterized protein n=1 Tax=Neobodo designis TaxID=312471 RepID=A0A7S1R374_NEODS
MPAMPVPTGSHDNATPADEARCSRAGKAVDGRRAADLPPRSPSTLQDSAMSLASLADEASAPPEPTHSPRMRRFRTPPPALQPSVISRVSPSSDIASSILSCHTHSAASAVEFRVTTEVTRVRHTRAEALRRIQLARAKKAARCAEESDTVDKGPTVRLNAT